VPWCRFFIPKIASSTIRAEDPELNEHIMYAKCIKGHALRDANDWILCENLPAPDAQCWKEGGETIFSLLKRKRGEASAVQTDNKQESLGTTPSKSSI
jgi:hypothetical protein